MMIRYLNVLTYLLTLCLYLSLSHDVNRPEIVLQIAPISFFLTFLQEGPAFFSSSMEKMH